MRNQMRDSHLKNPKYLLENGQDFYCLKSNTTN